MPSFAEQTKMVFLTELQMISCHVDNLDVSFEDVGPFDLPVPGNGTLCAEAMAHSLRNNPHCTSLEHITWIDLLQRMSTYLQDQGIPTAGPRLLVSWLLQVNQPHTIISPYYGKSFSETSSFDWHSLCGARTYLDEISQQSQLHGFVPCVDARLSGTQCDNFDQRQFASGANMVCYHESLSKNWQP
jgi:hypothetical protein